MKKQALATLNGKQSTTVNALTQLMRLQQITCGHFKSDDGVTQPIKNNRIDKAGAGYGPGIINCSKDNTGVSLGKFYNIICKDNIITNFNISSAEQNKLINTYIVTNSNIAAGVQFFYIGDPARVIRYTDDNIITSSNDENA